MNARRQKRSFLRQHWLTGAFALSLMGAAAFAGMQLYRTELRLLEVERERAKVEAQVQAARRKNEALEQKLKQVSSDEYMEYMAKSMGFYYANETVYQKGSGQR
jgi:cell division protein FtsL